MASVRFADLQSRPTEFLDFTSLTLAEFQQLVPPFEAAFQAHMAAWRLDGQPRTARQFSVDKNCLLPTPEDRLFFLLTSLKTYSLQVVQGRLFGMGQSKANQWIHVLLPALLAALAQRLGVSEADAATVVAPLEEEAAPVVAAPVAVPDSPLVPMTGPNGALSAPRTLLNSKRVRAARKRTIRSKMCSWSMPCSSSSVSVTPMAAASMISPWLTRRRIPCLREAGCYRISASWRSRCHRWRSSCPPRNPAARN